jgi:nucleoside-diphosphate-sugar epimerase
VTAQELQALRESNGIKPLRFALFHYVDVRDLANACRLAVERPLPGSNVFFVGSGESLVSEALCSLYPKLMPSIGDKAAKLTGASASVSIERIKKALEWTPVYSWRSGPL